MLKSLMSFRALTKKSADRNEIYCEIKDLNDLDPKYISGLADILDLTSDTPKSKKTPAPKFSKVEIRASLNGNAVTDEEKVEAGLIKSDGTVPKKTMLPASDLLAQFGSKIDAKTESKIGTIPADSLPDVTIELKESLFDLLSVYLKKWLNEECENKKVLAKRDVLVVKTCNSNGGDGEWPGSHKSVKVWYELEDKSTVGINSYRGESFLVLGRKVA